MKRYFNGSIMTYAGERESSEIDWQKQMLYSYMRPGKVFCKKSRIIQRKPNHKVFDDLDKNNLKKLFNLVHPGDIVRLTDSADRNMQRYINDLFYVERISFDGKIFGKFQNADVYMELLPQMDVFINGNRKINIISYHKERGRDR